MSDPDDVHEQGGEIAAAVLRSMGQVQGRATSDIIGNTLLDLEVAGITDPLARAAIVRLAAATTVLAAARPLVPESATLLEQIEFAITGSEINGLLRIIDQQNPPSDLA
jgi:hypothetical protein